MCITSRYIFFYELDLRCGFEVGSASFENSASFLFRLDSLSSSSSSSSPCMDFLAFFMHDFAFVSFSLYAWGDGRRGQLGNGKPVDVFFPEKVRMDTRGRKIYDCACGDSHAALQLGTSDHIDMNVVVK